MKSNNKPKETQQTQYTFDKKGIKDAVYYAIRHCANHLRQDVLDALEESRLQENTIRAKKVLEQLCQNAHIAQNDHVPLCQDTGYVWILLEIGNELDIPAGILDCVNNAVAQAYTDGLLRMSMVKDALFDRSNTKNNTPACVELSLVPGKQVTLHLMLKGGGSDNASSVHMLAPGEGICGIKNIVLEQVRKKAANACPPLIVGVGVGSSFDKVGGLAKRALLRPLNEKSQSAEHAKLEKELLDAINNTGIGPAALGGKTTALALHILSEPCHIAALPVAVNLGCCAMRSISLPLLVS